MQVAIGDAFGELRPYAGGFRAEVEIDFANPLIGRQSYAFDLNPERFRRDICRARTFGCMDDVARLWSAGFALGASFENTVVFDDTRLLNTEGLRYSDECVRHKVLDAIGDLALAGLPLLGAYRSVRGGHKLNHAVLTALMADRSAWRIVEAETRPPSRACRSRQRNGRRHDRPGLWPGRVLSAARSPVHAFPRDSSPTDASARYRCRFPVAEPASRLSPGGLPHIRLVNGLLFELNQLAVAWQALRARRSLRPCRFMAWRARITDRQV